jgi:hypothetical protein
MRMAPTRAKGDIATRLDAAPQQKGDRLNRGGAAHEGRTVEPQPRLERPL